MMGDVSCVFEAKPSSVAAKKTFYLSGAAIVNALRIGVISLMLTSTLVEKLYSLIGRLGHDEAQLEF